jgi:hypothetical protein
MRGAAPSHPMTSSPPASFFTLERGTPVADRFAHPVGTIERVLIAYGTYFDGIVVATPVGARFVDAPEVRRIARDHVELAITLSDVVHPGPKGNLGPPGIHESRRDRSVADDDDRSIAMTRLKMAFVEDRIDIDELERRVELVHRASRLCELERLVRDID